MLLNCSKTNHALPVEEQNDYACANVSSMAKRSLISLIPAAVSFRCPFLFKSFQKTVKEASRGQHNKFLFEEDLLVKRSVSPLLCRWSVISCAHLCFQIFFSFHYTFVLFICEFVLFPWRIFALPLIVVLNRSIEFHRDIFTQNLIMYFIFYLKPMISQSLGLNDESK